MLSFSGSLKVLVAVETCDMHRSFNGLHNAVANQLQEDPKSAAIFAFTNKRRSLLKILYWDGRKAAGFPVDCEVFDQPEPADDREGGKRRGVTSRRGCGSTSATSRSGLTETRRGARARFHVRK
ncbi:MAG: IS66 family insertion sequence element accessory protein TnpB [Luteolibacter sp.]|jgi:transposase|nr:IS66 family insertion sequence element accessory protein TnpB [Luteolibacter sp.]